jgi:hypothetical protein
VSTPTQEALDILVRHAAEAAAPVAMLPYPTEAARTVAIVQRAIQMLRGNGLIEITPTERWPTYVALDPPFEIPTQRSHRTP